MTTPTTVQVQIQLRADTAANWASENPTLLANEVGLETDTKKLKVGDGTTAWNTLAYFPSIVTGGTVLGNLEIGTTGTLTFEGSTADGFETTLAVTDPTADRTITLPDQSGTVVVTGNASIVNADIAADAEIAVSKLANGTVNQVLVTDGTDVSWSDDLTLAGNLTVNGTTTTVNTETLTVKDKNIELAVVDTPTDTTADGGGITLKGATDKTITWSDTSDSWEFNQPTITTGNSSAAAFVPTGSTVPSNGVYLPSANNVAISTNGAQALYINADGDILVADGNRMEIDEIRARDGAGLKLFDDAGAGIFVQDGGNVGLGTSSPSQQLHVTSASNTTALIAGGGTGYAQLKLTGGSTENYIDSDDPLQLSISGTTRATLTSTGLGIGTTSPGNPLHVSAATNTVARLTSTSTTQTYLRFENTSNSLGYLGYEGADMTFWTNNTEKARIDSSGRLLVGTSTSTHNISNQSKVAIVVTGNLNQGGLDITGYTGGSSTYTAPELNFNRSRGTTDGSVTALTAATWRLGAIRFSGSNGSGFGAGAEISAFTDSSVYTTSNSPAYLSFATTPVGASSPTERARITSNGYFQNSKTGSYPSTSYPLFATDTTDWYALGAFNSAASPYGLAVRFTGASPNNATNQFIYCRDSTANRFIVMSNGGVHNYSANNVNLSDRNTKKDITPAANTWDCLKEWEIVNFRYKEQPSDADLSMGVIAQQIAESCPEVVTVFQEAKDATEEEPAQEERLGVKDQQMVWMAIKALQEAQLRIETLEAEVAALKAS